MRRGLQPTSQHGRMNKDRQIKARICCKLPNNIKPRYSRQEHDRPSSTVFAKVGSRNYLFRWSIKARRIEAGTSSFAIGTLDCIAAECNTFFEWGPFLVAQTMIILYYVNTSFCKLICHVREVFARLSHWFQCSCK